jgi:glycosyltransferase involved in cell wall biosynthesis
MKVALIISTYNWVEALKLVLLSVKNQSVLPNEIIIADDGSTNKTKTIITKFDDLFDIPLMHIWHEDIGFTKSIILNKAIAKSKSKYIIQVDGDCILHRHFIKDHLALMQKEYYLFGSRVNIQKKHLDKLFPSNQIKFNWFSKGIKKRTRAIHMPILNNFYKPTTKFSKKFRGCNVSFFKKDFIAVNGYDENFKGWGREDSELAIRLHNYGLKAKRLRYRGIVFHIFHFEKPKNRLELNNKIQQKTLTEKKAWCENGIDKYL